MKVSIPYGNDVVQVTVHDPCKVLKPNSIEGQGPRACLSNALSNPIHSPSLSELMTGSDRGLVLVTDATRPTPTAEVLESIREHILAHRDMGFLVATGTHRSPTPGEFDTIFGRIYNRIKGRVIVHKPELGNCSPFGRTSRGTEVYLNEEILDADLLITINNVKPHYFAGFTGGRKTFLPGIAAFETVEANHSLATSEDARPMRLEGNPVSEDMDEAAAFVRNAVFSVQTVVTHNHGLHSAAAGGLSQSFVASVDSARELYSAPLDQRGNVVVTANPHPMDINLYQAQHAIENANLATDDGGILILVSKCWDGVGNDSFLKAFDRVRNLEDVQRELESGYRLGFHKVSRVMAMLERIRIWAVTDLEPGVVQRAKMRPFTSIQKAVDQAIETLKGEGQSPRVVVMPSGGMTVPSPGMTE